MLGPDDMVEVVLSVPRRLRDAYTNIASLRGTSRSQVMLGALVKGLEPDPHATAVHSQRLADAEYRRQGERLDLIA